MARQQNQSDPVRVVVSVVVAVVVRQFDANIVVAVPVEDMVDVVVGATMESVDCCR